MQTEFQGKKSCQRGTFNEVKLYFCPQFAKTSIEYKNNAELQKQKVVKILTA